MRKNSKSSLDHVYSTDINKHLMPSIPISDISDHFPVFVLTTIAKHPKSDAYQTSKRDRKDFKTKRCIQDLNQTSIASLLTIFSTIYDQFKQFINSFTSVVNEHASRKFVATRKEKKLKIKPWLPSSLQ